MNLSGDKRRPRLVWLTNSPAPYRDKVWARLAEEADLRVMLVGGLKSEHRWSTESASHFRFVSRRSLVTGILCEYFVVGKWECASGIAAVVLRRLLGKQVSIFYESTLFSQKHQTGVVALARRTLFRLATSIITVGRASTDAVRAMGVESSRIYEGVNAVDVDHFSRRSREIRALEPEVATGHTTIFVGQLIPRKNPMLALEGWSEHAEECDRLYVVGSGPEIEALQDAAKRSGYEERIEFTGYRSGDDLIRLLSRSNTLVLPASEEVWGLVVNEALACGLHVVVSEYAGVASSFGNMQGVYICDTTVQSIAIELTRSRQSWRGYICSPEVLQFTPEALADVALSALVSGR